MSSLLVAFFIFPLLQGAKPRRRRSGGKDALGRTRNPVSKLSRRQGEGAFRARPGRSETHRFTIRSGGSQTVGIMPAFVESQVSDREMADFVAYFDSLPSVSRPGGWRFEVPCSPRSGSRAVDHRLRAVPRPDAERTPSERRRRRPDFQWFTNMVHQHATFMPTHWKTPNEQPAVRVRMGTHRVPVCRKACSRKSGRSHATWGSGLRGRTTQRRCGRVRRRDVHAGRREHGAARQGARRRRLTINVVVPAGATVVRTTGEGYQGFGRMPS